MTATLACRARCPGRLVQRRGSEPHLEPARRRKAKRKNELIKRRAIPRNGRHDPTGIISHRPGTLEPPRAPADFRNDMRVTGSQTARNRRFHPWPLRLSGNKARTDQAARRGFHRWSFFDRVAEAASIQPGGYPPISTSRGTESGPNCPRSTAGTCSTTCSGTPAPKSRHCKTTFRCHVSPQPSTSTV